MFHWFNEKTTRPQALTFNSNRKKNKKNTAVVTLSFTKQHVWKQTGGVCAEGEAQTCQQEVSGSAGHPEGQTDSPSHKDAGGGEASTPVCPHTRLAAAPLIKHKAPPRKDTTA